MRGEVVRGNLEVALVTILEKGVCKIFKILNDGGDLASSSPITASFFLPVFRFFREARPSTHEFDR